MTVRPAHSAPHRQDPLSGLYPPIDPFHFGRLQVPGGHDLYFEQSGNRAGKPVVFLHGGPGGGTDPKHRRFFDPARYRIILFDQRGCGQSEPFASLEDNTTWDLVDDIERLREHLGVDRWQVFGGSWGSTLGVAYAEAHPHRVTELVLRGIFMFTRRESDWFYGRGTRNLFPDAWEAFVAPIPEAERADLIAAYYRRLTSNDPRVRVEAARAWSLWESRVAALHPDPDVEMHCDNTDFTLAFSRIECHYFVNKGFLNSETQLLDDAPKIQHIPTTIVHGRYDVICPLENAWHLHKRLPRSELVIVPDAGHSAFEPGIALSLRRATDRYSQL
ncbi:prolyl aminopeptidase [Nannocystis bainbridge]|uniref:Proline iminopeptidase n=1 Tax=Nannocystis bainbridge TaxID=2995303 RepID=A0ABT5DU42_9BACT|nr:prolyl aminopeptidase [Nannocystis bainbridge]MDC0717146.1 prolyl aminopeptidase [Nannocystis bainbridge]